MKGVLAAGLLLLVGIGAAFAGGQMEVVEPTETADGFKQVEMADVTLSWQIDGEDARIRVSAPTTGWVAVGFDPASIMQDANMIIGYVDGDTVLVEDHFGTGRIRHRADTELGGTRDVSAVEGSERNGRTELAFTIPLDSRDQYDRVLREGNMHAFIFAYGNDGDDDLSSYHKEASGFQAEF